MKEIEIRPQNLFDKYIKLGKKDIQKYFSTTKLIPITCPACSHKGTFAFSKFSFHYDECSKCKTLYVNPRPEKTAFDNYYSNSESSKFWANEFYKITEKSRRNKIWQPKAKYISKKLKELGNIRSIVDIGGGYGIFIEEFKKLNNTVTPLIIEPSNQLAQICKRKKIPVICDFFENIDPKSLPQNKTLYTSFELFEHLHNPRLFLQKLFDTIKKNDIFLFTTLNGMGIDIQVLWEKSKSVSPPHHLNFFNPKSIKKLLEKTGFKVLEISTPGKLDIDIMRNNIKDIDDKFWKNFLEHSSKKEQDTIQKYLRKNLLSSHMMIICQK